jgi:DNA-binding transcriptional MerR regulator
MSDELFTIGRLARRTGVPVRTIRFWSDLGLLTPAGRSSGGYRLYDTEAVARLDLVRTLRELGLGLDLVQAVLDRQTTLAEIADVHVRALDAEIRSLRLRRAVLRTVAARGSTTEEMALMHKLARLSALERQDIIDDFVDRTFEGVDGGRIAEAMRKMPAELPDDPTPEQVDAWVELAELVQDESFRERVREMALGRRPDREEPANYDAGPVIEHAGGAVTQGIAPESPAGREVLDRIVEPSMPAAGRAELREQLIRYTDARVERYWQLMGVINDRPAFPAAVPAFEWLIRALQAHRDPR